MKRVRDLRESDVSGLERRERARFASLAYCTSLVRAGLDSVELELEIESLTAELIEPLTRIGLQVPPDQFLYSPFIQDSDSILELAVDLGSP